jgi:hypothetical protein
MVVMLIGDVVRSGARHGSGGEVKKVLDRRREWWIVKGSGEGRLLERSKYIVGKEASRQAMIETGAWSLCKC